MSRQFSQIALACGLALAVYVHGDSSEEIQALPSKLTTKLPTLISPRILDSLEIKDQIGDQGFVPFTGKVIGNKVRVRVCPDLESSIVEELKQGDLIVVIGEKGDFYALEPPVNTKAYIARQFVLDGVIEATNRINVRLEPSLEAPIIGYLSSGQTVKGKVSPLNNKWYEISPPLGTRFYIAKNYVEGVGGPEVKTQIAKKRTYAEQLLETALLLTKVEMKKPFQNIDISPIKQAYQKVLNEYTEFSDLCVKAKDHLNTVQEDYVQRKIAYLETLAEQKISAASNHETTHLEGETVVTDWMTCWDPNEYNIYQNWVRHHPEASMEDFYQCQQEDSMTLTGIIEPYLTAVQCKPGDFILRDKDKPIGYLYSTQVNLHNLVGKKVTLQVSSRPNNNFAFPAYFVLSVQ